MNGKVKLLFHPSFVSHLPHVSLLASVLYVSTLVQLTNQAADKQMLKC